MEIRERYVMGLLIAVPNQFPIKLEHGYNVDVSLIEMVP